jgi:hypothetical protein
MKLIIIILICLFLSFTSCKNENNTKSVLPKKLQQIELPKQKVNDSLKRNLKEEPLNKEQLSDFFPDYLGSNKRFDIFMVSGDAMAVASYGSFESNYNYSILDGVKNKIAIENFEISYNTNLKTPEGTEYIKKEREGFKTIAFLQPNISRNNIQFIYKNRFKLVIEGPDHPDVLWSYIKKEDLKKLDTY